MKPFWTVANQWGFGFGYRHCLIIGSNRHMLWLNLGYKSVAYSWGKNK